MPLALPTTRPLPRHFEEMTQMHVPWALPERAVLVPEGPAAAPFFVVISRESCLVMLEGVCGRDCDGLLLEGITKLGQGSGFVNELQRVICAWCQL